MGYEFRSLMQSVSFRKEKGTSQDNGLFRYSPQPAREKRDPEWNLNAVNVARDY